MIKVTFCPASAMPGIAYLGFNSWAMRNADNLLMVEDTDHDANMLYATGLFVPDPFIYLRIRGRNYIVMSDLEIDRARKQAPHCRVIPLSRYQDKLREAGIKQPGIAHVIRAILREKRIHRLVVPKNFPYGLVADLRRAGIKLDVAPNALFPEREHKSPAEVRKISAALTM